MTIKLTDLNPRFVGAGGDGVTNAETGEPVPERHGVGITFDCPCGKCGERPCIIFSNPLDGGEDYGNGNPTWERTGKTFETISLKPSLQRKGGCNWHGFLTDGYFKEC